MSTTSPGAAGMRTRGSSFMSCWSETDGGDVGRNCIRALSAVAINEHGHAIGQFHMNLAPLEGRTVDQRTLARYRAHNESWASITQDAQRPSIVMQKFVVWVQGLPGLPVAVGNAARPAFALARDLSQALHQERVLPRAIRGEMLFGGGGIDLPSLVMGQTGLQYRKSVEYLLPAEWREGRVETHRPREDVEMHAALLKTMLRFRAQRAQPV